jgi:hypothetical protein
MEDEFGCYSMERNYAIEHSYAFEEVGIVCYVIR